MLQRLHLLCFCRRLIKEMEEKQLSEKAELERLQQEVESQRKESEEVQQRILRQEESLRRRSQDIESRLRDFLAEKERFEEERRSEIQEVALQRRRQQEEEQQEAAEQTEIYRELERLKREREEQQLRLETERRRLEEQEREQLSLVGRLEEQLREKQEAAAALLTKEDVRRLEEERRSLAELREALLRAKEAAERTDVEEEAGSVQRQYTAFKEAQVNELEKLEEGLRHQREQLEKEVVAERSTLLLLLAHGLKDHQQQGAQEGHLLFRQAEQRLQSKERQLSNLVDGLLPALAEEKQRAVEVLERSAEDGLDNTLFQVEKELEDKEEKLHLLWHGAQQLQQLQETYEFTANVARQEEKVRRKEKEILESKEQQQREAMEQAVARLERRQSALRRSVSLEAESVEQTGGGLDQQRSGRLLGRRRLSRRSAQSLVLVRRVEQEIRKLRQRISEGENQNRSQSVGTDSGSPVGHIQSLNTLLPLSDDR